MAKKTELIGLKDLTNLIGGAIKWRFEMFHWKAEFFKRYAAEYGRPSFLDRLELMAEVRREFGKDVLKLDIDHVLDVAVHRVFL